MRELTLHDLREIMRDCAETDPDVDLDGDIADIAFADLGYDSLVLLEILGRIQQEFGMRVPDSALEHMHTPGTTIAWLKTLVLPAA